MPPLPVSLSKLPSHKCHASAPLEPEPMQIGRVHLSAEDHIHRITMKLCLYCGGSVHLSSEMRSDSISHSPMAHSSLTKATPTFPGFCKFLQMFHQELQHDCVLSSLYFRVDPGS